MKCFHGNDAQTCPYDHGPWASPCYHGNDACPHTPRARRASLTEYRPVNVCEVKQEQPSILKQLIPFWPFD
jgi:hypothetical protein